MIIDETERLCIKEIEESDADAAAALLTLVEQRNEKTFTRDMVLAYINDAYGFYGYGYWGMYEKATDELIGIAGFREGSCPLEVGYCVRDDKRNMGYATEAVRSLVEFAEEDFLWVLEEELQGVKVTGEVLLTYEKNGRVLLYGRTESTNRPSINVLKKNGFKENEGFIR